MTPSPRRGRMLIHLWPFLVRLDGVAARLEQWLVARNRRPAMGLGVLAALLAVQISPWWYPAADGVLYLSIARSIVRGEHVRRLGSPQLAFPPGYPLIISPAFLLGDRPFLLLSIIHWVMAVLFMFGVYVWARRRCAGGALLITGLVMVNISLWNQYRRTLSELAFMTVAVWTVYVLDVAEASASRRKGLIWVLSGSAMLVFLAMIREVGVTFAAGFVAARLVDVRRGRLRWGRAVVLAAAVVLPATMAVVGFARYDVVAAEQSADQTGTHWDGLVQPAFAGRLTEGVRLRIGEIGRLLVPGMFKAYNGPGEWLNVNMVLYCAVCLVVGVGWRRLIVRRPADVFALTAPFYLAAYVVWPFDGATRYALPLLPLLFATLWYVVEPLRYRRCVLAALLVAHLGVAGGYWLVKELPATRACNAEWSVIDQLAERIEDGRHQVLAANIPECVRFMLELSLDRAVLLPSSPTFAPADVRWVVTPSTTPAYPEFATAATAGAFKLLVRDGGG